VNDDTLTIISSDGHVSALMADYRPYLDKEYLDDFDAFLVEWNEVGTRSFDRAALAQRLDPEDLEHWSEHWYENGRIDAICDPHQRLKETEREGIVGEVLFPEFGLPFQLYPPSVASALGRPPISISYAQAGMRAHNRWLADFVSVAPERFAGMAIVCWHDVEGALADIRWAVDAGLRGLVLPAFDPKLPLYHPSFEPIWNLLDELSMVVNSHVSISSTSNLGIDTSGAPHPGCAIRMYNPENIFFCRNILNHLIWGGVFERHPDLTFVFTEQGSGWLISMLRELDYAYDGSYFRTDYHVAIRSKPSEYFARQCYLGSSTFSRAEIAARNEIGIDKMMIGMDFPHHEGTVVETTEEYLRATFGAERVPLAEAAMMLGETAARVFGFDLDALEPIAARVGLRSENVLTPPERDLFPRGDVHKPL
jgi:predicted TIM-barrel fold metal-dependent hydrolase